MLDLSRNMEGTRKDPTSTQTAKRRENVALILNGEGNSDK